MSIGFVAYIDESGDDGIARVRSATATGSSEWFVLSAVVVRASRATETVGWVRDILAKLSHRQRADLHYQALSPWKRQLVCQELAKLPIRCFVVASNKKNMEGYRNPYAEKVPARNWFYCWVSRLLLERVTDFCERRSIRDGGTARTLQIEFSRRGGMSYGQFRAYLDWLRNQSRAESLFLKGGDLRWSVIDTNHVFAFDHSQRAGLQLADVVAGAFFQSVERTSKGVVTPTYAKLLKPRMCPNLSGSIANYGLKLMPTLRRAKLTPEQEEIFKFYDYPDERW